jgi:hypothetical protein
MNFELATRVDDCTLEDLSVVVEEPAADAEVAEVPAVEVLAEEVPAAAAAAEATEEIPDVASTGYQLSLCWCG